MAFQGKENAICCDLCDLWYHIKCSNMSLKVFKTFLTNTTKVWYCKNCIDTILPFSSLTNLEFDKLYQSKFANVIQKIKNENVLSEICSVCTKKSNKKTAIPCSSCKTLCFINTKCSNKASIYISYSHILTS